MMQLFNRIWLSPRLGRVVFALCIPLIATFIFSPLWVSVASLVLVFAATIYMYVAVLSARYVHRKTVHTTLQSVAANPLSESMLHSWLVLSKDVSRELVKAQTQLATTLQQAEDAAISVGEAVTQIHKGVEKQSAITKTLLVHGSQNSEKPASLADLTLLASKLLTLCASTAHQGIPANATQLKALSKDLMDQLSETQQQLSTLAQTRIESETYSRQAIVALQYQDITSQSLCAIKDGTLQKVLEKHRAMYRASQGDVTPSTDRHVEPTSVAKDTKKSNDPIELFTS
jgi:arsenate reductase-like glutaredoxin family protein